MQTVSILIVGDEILKGEIADENGPYMIRRLGMVGVNTVRQVVVGDCEEDIVAEMTRLKALADAVVISGGLGPTHDDLTRPAVARALGLPLETNEEAVRRIHGFYADMATEEELGMARLPKGARVVDGLKTGTFGFEIEGVYAFPGVPFLFRDLIERIASEFDGEPLHCEELRSDRREGEIAATLDELQARYQDVAIGSYPVHEDGRWHVRVVLRGRDPVRVAALVAEISPAL